MKVLIIEDEAPAFRRLQKLLEEIDNSLEIVDVLDSVEDSIKWLKHHNAPELIFMDIQLSDGISFDIFKEHEVESPVIFTTAFDEYTLRAFKVNSIDYILKPIKKEDLEAALKKLYHLKTGASSQKNDLSSLLSQIKLDEKRYKNRFLVKQGEKLLAVDIQEIAFFYLHMGITHFMTWKGKSMIQDYTLDELEKVLDPQEYFRANRQYILHFKSIKIVNRYHKGKLLLETQPIASEPIIVSAEKAGEFKKWLGGE